jgi:hypothetical protein
VVPTRNGTPIDASDAVHAFKADLDVLGLRVEAGERRDRGGTTCAAGTRPAASRTAPTR